MKIVSNFKKPLQVTLAVKNLGIEFSTLSLSIDYRQFLTISVLIGSVTLKITLKPPSTTSHLSSRTRFVLLSQMSTFSNLFWPFTVFKSKIIKIIPKNLISAALTASLSALNVFLWLQKSLKAAKKKILFVVNRK